MRQKFCRAIAIREAISRLTSGYAFVGLLLLIFGTAAQAQIAPGVTQSAAHTANITGTVNQGNGTPVAGANVQLSGAAVLSTKTDEHGTFAFTSVPWGTYSIVVISADGTVSRKNIQVNGDITVAIQYQPQGTLKEIAQVSTANAGAHINITSSSITSVNPADYAFQGNAQWKNLFAQVPGVAASGYTSGGGLYATAIVNAPQAPVVLSINGALPYETSTTLDGMPLINTSENEFIEDGGGGTDLSNLPVDAFDTADVVRGPGANAPSIVDSINGTFVLHAPGQVETNQAEFSISNDPYGGIISNAKVALHLGRLSATFIYGIDNSPGPLGTGGVIPAYSFTPLAIDGVPVRAVTGAENLNGQGVVNCYCSITDTLLYCCAPHSTSWSQQTGAASLLYKVTPSITAQLFYAGGTSRDHSTGGYFPVEFAPGSGYSGSFMPSPPGEANYQSFLFALGSEPVTSSVSSLLEEKVTAFVGRGVLRLATLQYNTYNWGNEADACFPSGTYTLWGTATIGTTSPGTTTAFNGVPATLTFPDYALNETWSSHNRDLLGSYALQIGSATSMGISYSRSYYDMPYALNEFLPGSPNISLYALSQGSDISETTDEIRLHAEAQASNKLSLGLSWYFARGTFHIPTPGKPASRTDSVFPYSAPRLGAVWQANSNIAIRASAGGGFALPAVYSLTGYSLLQYGGEYLENTANLGLKPETTVGFDVGTDMRFHRDTVLSLDFFQTNLYGQYYTSTTTSTFNGLPLFITQLSNLATSRYEGINLDLHHDVPHGIYWHGTLGFTRGYVVSVPANFYNNYSCPNTPCTNQSIIPGPNFNSGTYGATVPYSSASLQLGYRWKPGKYVDLQSTYYGNNNIYLTPGAFVEFDAHAGYPITKNLSLLATFENITGVYDQSLDARSLGTVTPVVQGAVGYYPGASTILPYGPRTVLVTARVTLP